MSDYEKFQLQWMIDRGHSLRELMEELQSLQYDDLEDSDQISTPITELFAEWEAERGFGSEIWPCEAEYESREKVERYLDELYELVERETDGEILSESDKKRYVWLFDEIHRLGGDIPFGVEI